MRAGYQRLGEKNFKSANSPIANSPIANSPIANSPSADPDPSKLIQEVRKNIRLLSAFSSDVRSQISLLISLAESCNDCQLLSTYFVQIVLLFLKSKCKYLSYFFKGCLFSSGLVTVNGVAPVN